MDSGVATDAVVMTWREAHPVKVRAIQEHYIQNREQSPLLSVRLRAAYV